MGEIVNPRFADGTGHHDRRAAVQRDGDIHLWVLEKTAAVGFDDTLLKIARSHADAGHSTDKRQGDGAILADGACQAGDPLGGIERENADHQDVVGAESVVDIDAVFLAFPLGQDGGQLRGAAHAFFDVVVFNIGFA